MKFACFQVFIDSASDDGPCGLNAADLMIRSPSQLMDIVRLRTPSNLRAAVPLVVAGRIEKEPLPGFASMLPELLGSPHWIVRSAALHLAGITGDPEALDAVVASGWTSETASRTRERITGSIALIEAARNGIVAARETLPRLAPETFGAACARLDDGSVEQLATMLDACVRAASGLDVPAPPVEMALAITRTDNVIDPRLSLNEGNTAKSFADALRGLAGGQSEFDARQKKLQHAYRAFRNQLTPQMVAVVLDAFHLDEIRTILRVAPDLVHGWIKLLQEATMHRRRALRNFGIYVACALTHGDTPSKGIELLTLLQNGTSFVHVRYTLADLPLEAVALWWSADSSAVNRLRFARLDACGNDHELALESATAIFANKAATLTAYVRTRLTSTLPVDVARAITVAGFSNDAVLASEVVANFTGDEGLLVAAARSCQYAMDRYRWSKHWLDKMLTASTEEEFWTASVLFLKVVDARFEAEHRNEPVGTEVFNAWWWSVERRLKRRFDKWADKRKKTLFGSKVPDSIYLSQAHYVNNPEL